MSNQRDGTRYVRNAQLAKYLNISAMTVWRWQRDESLKFPKPRVINGNPFTDLDLVDDWMRTSTARRAKTEKVA